MSHAFRRPLSRWPDRSRPRSAVQPGRPVRRRHSIAAARHLGGPALALLIVLAGMPAAQAAAQPAHAATVGSVAITPAATAPITPLEGIDVSAWQTTINWPQVAASGKAFAMIRASVGRNYVDTYYATNHSAARAAGMRTGAYHFAQPDATANDAILEADRFVASMGLLSGDLTPALDLEDSGGLSVTDLQAWVAAWLGEVTAKTGVRPMIYTSPNFWTTYMGDSSALADAGYKTLWVAHWGVSSPTVPANNWGGRGWTFWQYSDCGSVPGITTGCVDLDRYNGTDLTAVTVGADFSVSATPASRPVKQGIGTSFAVSLTRTYFTLPVSLSVSGLPAGATGTFDVTSTAGTTATLSVTTSRIGTVTPVGTYPLTISGVSGGVTRTTTATLVVSAGATFVPLSPARLLDTRVGNGLAGAFGNASARTFQVTGRGGVPANAIAVTGNLTVTGQTAGGYFFLGPIATNSPTSSTINFPAGDDRANGVTLSLSSRGTLSATYIASAGQTSQLVFDVTGYFTQEQSGATYVALNPTRVLDTRVGNGLPGAFGSGVPRTFQVTGRGNVPAGAIAVTGNLTVTLQTAAGYVFLGPVASNTPTSSTINVPVGDNRANGVTVALSPNGTLDAVYMATPGQTSQIILDVTGYFTADPGGSIYVPLNPARLLDTRVGNGLTGAFGNASARTFQVTGRGGVPGNATAITGNLTVTGQTAAGYFFLGPIATNTPGSSTINFPLGDNRANGLTIALGSNGTLSATYVAVPGGTSQLVFDVTGYFLP